MTREGEPLEDYRGEKAGLLSRSSIRIAVPVIVGFIVLIVILAAASRLWKLVTEECY